MSHVYQARAAGSSAEQSDAYAIKVLRPEWQDDPRALATLAREAHLGRKVIHPHLVPILAAQLQTPPYYIAMPYLAGRTLEVHLRSAAFDLPVVFWTVRQVAEALTALATAGWTHGDVKPSNIIVSFTGHVTLIDLGFAQPAKAEGSLADRPVVGTIHYIAPELLSTNHHADIRSDVYSLGVTLFRMLAGRLPFDAEDVAELARQHRQHVPGEVRSLAPHLPKRAARLVRQMLAKQSLRRPTPEELIERLTALEIETFAERFAASIHDDDDEAATGDD